MSDGSLDIGRRDLSVLSGQGSFAIMGWTLAGPSIVLTYIVVALGLPVLVAGLLVSARQFSCFVTNVFGTHSAKKIRNRKLAIALVDAVVAASYALVVVVAVAGNLATIITGLFVAVVIGSAAKEYKVLLMTDLLGDNLLPASRRRIQYAQMLFAGIGAIILALASHWYVRDNPQIDHYLIILAIAIICFLGSSILILNFNDRQSSIEDSVHQRDRTGLLAHTFLPDLQELLRLGWFRQFLVLRLMTVSACLALPFFSLITALTHGASSGVLTTLIVSSAAATLVASGLWQNLNKYSNTLVVTLGAVLIAATGLVLLVEHNFQLANSIFLHATVLFVVTIALKGLTSALTLQMLAVAPKQQRVACQSVSKSICRLFVVVLSLILAGLAHVGAINLLIVVIIGFAIAAALTGPRSEPAPAHQA